MKRSVFEPGLQHLFWVIWGKSRPSLGLSFPIYKMGLIPVPTARSSLGGSVLVLRMGQEDGFTVWGSVGSGEYVGEGGVTVTLSPSPSLLSGL